MESEHGRQVQQQLTALEEKTLASFAASQSDGELEWVYKAYETDRQTVLSVLGLLGTGERVTIGVFALRVNESVNARLDERRRELATLP